MPSFEVILLIAAVLLGPPLMIWAIYRMIRSEIRDARERRIQREKGRVEAEQQAELDKRNEEIAAENEAARLKLKLEQFRPIQSRAQVDENIVTEEGRKPSVDT